MTSFLLRVVRSLWRVLVSLFLKHSVVFTSASVSGNKCSSTVQMYCIKQMGIYSKLTYIYNQKYLHELLCELYHLEWMYQSKKCNCKFCSVTL